MVGYSISLINKFKLGSNKCAKLNCADQWKPLLQKGMLDNFKREKLEHDRCRFNYKYCGIAGRINENRPGN